jgi:hypothetical protein
MDFSDPIFLTAFLSWAEAGIGRIRGRGIRQKVLLPIPLPGILLPTFPSSARPPRFQLSFWLRLAALGLGVLCLSRPDRSVSTQRRRSEQIMERRFAWDSEAQKKMLNLQIRVTKQQSLVSESFSPSFFESLRLCVFALNS